MEHEGQRLRLPKLAADGGNWVVYRDRVIWAMQANSINDHISSDSAPAAYIAHGTIDNLTPENRWTKEENQIKQVLCSTLPDTAFNRIKGAANIKDAWIILKRVYEDRSKALVADVMRRFRNRRCEEKESVRSHFETLAELREQLAAMGKTIGDDDYTDTLLASLPASYDGAVSSISASARLGSKTLTAEIFEQLIIDEYERRQVKDRRSDPKDKDKDKDEALTADSSKRKGKDKRNVECFNCHKKGHYKTECYQKGGGQEGKGPKRGKNAQEDAAPAAEDTTEAWAAIDHELELTEELCLTAVAAAGSHPARAHQSRPGISYELYDSGASRHMSPLRERFVSYKAIPPRAITAADNRVFYAVGTGDLEIQVPNGESSTPVMLRDVLHAPDMGITIISVNRIAKAGYSVTFKDNTCQIRNKAGKLVGTIPASQNGR